MLLQRFEGGTALMASKNDFDRHWVSPINFNWLISISYLVECFLRYYAQSAQSGVSALRALHQPLSNVSAAFVVAPVWVGAKRIVEDYFDIRERAVIQLRHGRRASNFLTGRSYHLSRNSEFAALWIAGNGTAMEGS
jgi:hypothetical protein